MSWTPCLQAYGGVFPGSPPLDPNHYSKCYGMQLTGYVAVSSTINIQTSSSDNNTYQFQNQFRSASSCFKLSTLPAHGLQSPSFISYMVQPSLFLKGQLPPEISWEAVVSYLLGKA